MKRIASFCLCLCMMVLQAYALEKPDFYNIVDRDTAYFAFHPDGKTVSMVDWRHVNGKDTIVIPSKAYFEGRAYRVTAIGSEAMGCVFYGKDEWDRAYTPFGEEGLVIVPDGVTHIGYCAFTARLRNDFRVVLPNSVEVLEACAVNCLSIMNEKDEVILPKNLRRADWLHDGEDHDIPDFEFSKLYIPKHTEHIGNLDGFSKNQPRFKKTVVHPGNKHYKSIRGTLYSHDLDTIYWATVQEHLYIPKNLHVPVEDIYRFDIEGWCPAVQCPDFKTIEVESGNPYNYAKDGYLYDKVSGTLIMGVKDSTRVAEIPAWCKKIYVFDERQLPWSYKLADNAAACDIASFLTDLYDYREYCDWTTISYLGYTDTLYDSSIYSMMSFMKGVIDHNPECAVAEEVLEQLEDYCARRYSSCKCFEDESESLDGTGVSKAKLKDSSPSAHLGLLSLSVALMIALVIAFVSAIAIIFVRRSRKRHILRYKVLDGDNEEQAIITVETRRKKPETISVKLTGGEGDNVGNVSQEDLEKLSGIIMGSPTFDKKAVIRQIDEQFGPLGWKNVENKWD